AAGDRVQGRHRAGRHDDVRDAPGAGLAADPTGSSVTAHRRALALMALSAVSFGVMAFAVKLASKTMPAAQVAFFRFLFMLLPLAAPGLLRQALTWQRRDLLIYRGVFGGTAVLLYFLAIEHVPVG